MKITNNNINEDINNQRLPSFEDVNKKIDYSPIDEELRKHNLRKSILQKASIGFASVVLVVGVAFGVKILKITTKKAPFEMGTYTYTSQVGEIEGLDFSEQSYIVLSEEELNGPGTFMIENDEQDWVVYGAFNECEFETYPIGKINKKNDGYVFVYGNYQVNLSISKHNQKNNIILEFNDNDEKKSVFFTNNQ